MFSRRLDGVSISWAPEWFSLASLLSPHLSPLIGLGHYDPLSSHEIDGVRKEKERLTAVSLFPAHFSQLLCGLSLRTLRTCLCLLYHFLFLFYFSQPISFYRWVSNHWFCVSYFFYYFSLLLRYSVFV